MKEKLSVIAALVILLGTAFSVYFYFENRYALAEELKKVEQRLDYKISDDHRFSVQQEMRQIEERNNGKPIEKWDQRDRMRYKDLQDQLSKIQERLKVLQQK